MTLPKETVLTGAAHPGTELQLLQDLRVHLESAGGYYLGFLDRDGTPYSRETDYMTYPDALVMFEMIRRVDLDDLDAVPV